MFSYRKSKSAVLYDSKETARSRFFGNWEGIRNLNGCTDWGACEVGHTGEGPVTCCASFTRQLDLRSIAKKSWEAKERAPGYWCRSSLLLVERGLRRRFEIFLKRVHWPDLAAIQLPRLILRGGLSAPTCIRRRLWPVYCKSNRVFESPMLDTRANAGSGKVAQLARY